MGSQMEMEERYNKWWAGKYLKDGRRISKVVFHAPPSGICGIAEFVLEDGSRENVRQGSSQFKPSKSFVAQCQQVFDQPPERLVKSPSGEELPILAPVNIASFMEEFGSKVAKETRDIETETIFQEVKDHAAYWHSDMAKRITVEKHLKQKGIQLVEAKVDLLIKAGKLEVIKAPRGDYLKVIV